MRYKPKTKPFAHQSKATLRALRRHNLAFLMEPGCGKTKAVLDTIAIQALKGRIERVMVLGPISAVDGVWEDEMKTHFPLPYMAENEDEYWHGNQKGDGPNVSFYLMNYEKTSRRDRRGTKYVYPYIRQIEDFDPDCIVLDESQLCKRPGANRAQALWRLISRLRDKHPVYVYLMTGTPNPKGYIDLFAQFRIMDPTIFGTSKVDFEERYCVYGHGRNKYRIIRYRNKRQLLRKIKDHSFIITKEECLDLPKVIPQTIRVPLSESVRRAYSELAGEFITSLEGQVVHAANAGVKRLRLQQITGGFLTDGTVVHTDKLHAARDELETLFEAGEKAVVYCRFLPEVAAVAEVARKLGYRTFPITGETPRADRPRAYRDFTSSPSSVALVFQAETGSLAIDLTAGCNILFYSLPDNWSTYFQCISRMDRSGQTRSVTVRHLISPGTIDPRQLKALKEKRDLHAELMGNPRGFLLGI